MLLERYLYNKRLFQIFVTFYSIDIIYVMFVKNCQNLYSLKCRRKESFAHTKIFIDLTRRNDYYKIAIFLLENKWYKISYLSNELHSTMM